VQRLRQLVRGRAAARARAAAGGKETGNSEGHASGGSAADQLSTGDSTGHSCTSSSDGSTTKVASGLQLNVAASPAESAGDPVPAFCTKTVMRPDGVSTMYSVETPMYARSATVPWSVLVSP